MRDDQPAAATAHTRAQMRPQAHAAAGPATISLRKTKLGMILVNADETMWQFFDKYSLPSNPN